MCQSFRKRACLIFGTRTIDQPRWWQQRTPSSGRSSGSDLTVRSPLTSTARAACVCRPFGLTVSTYQEHTEPTFWLPIGQNPGVRQTGVLTRRVRGSIARPGLWRGLAAPPSRALLGCLCPLFPRTVAVWLPPRRPLFQYWLAAAVSCLRHGFVGRRGGVVDAPRPTDVGGTQMLLFWVLLLPGEWREGLLAAAVAQSALLARGANPACVCCSPHCLVSYQDVGGARFPGGGWHHAAGRRVGVEPRCAGARPPPPVVGVGRGGGVGASVAPPFHRQA